MTDSTDIEALRPRRKTTVVPNLVRLGELMAERGLTVDQFADRVMSLSATGSDRQRRIRDIFEGENPKPKTINEFAEVLGVTSAELIDHAATEVLHKEIDEHNRRLRELKKRRAGSQIPQPDGPLEQEVSEPSSTQEDLDQAAPPTVEEPPTPTEKSPDREGQSTPSRPWLPFALAGLVLLVVLIGLLQQPTTPEAAEDLADTPSLVTEQQPIPRPALAFYLPEGPQASRFAQAFAKNLEVYWPSIGSSEWLSSDQELPNHYDYGLDITTTLHSDYITVWITRSKGRQGDRTTIWSDVYPASASAALLTNVAKHSADKVNERLTSSRPFTVIDEREARSYIKGMKEFETGRSELMVRRVQSIFQRLADSHPSWPNARAAICAAHVEEHRLLRTSTSLAAAAPHCAEALRLHPDSTEALRAMALLERRRQNPKKAEQHLRKSLAIDDQNVPTLVGMSQLLAMRFTTEGAVYALEEAEQMADRAITADAQDWRSHFERARLYYLAEELDAAIRVSESALTAQENLFTTGNLTAYLTCRGSTGDFNRAATILEAYKNKQAVTIPVFTNLGIAYYYARDFDKAAREFKRALELESAAGGAGHHLLGNYADALRHLGRDKEAITTYQQALESANSGILRDENVLWHKTSAVYYQSALIALKSKSQSRTLQQQLDDHAERITAVENIVLGPTGRIRVAKAWLLINQKARARENTNLETIGCPGFLADVDLATL